MSCIEARVRTPSIADVFVALMSRRTEKTWVRSASSLDPSKLDAILVTPFRIAATVIVLTAYIVGAFYCLEALHAERSAHSILFWNSLPVSDLFTVLSKAGVPLVVLPVAQMTLVMVYGLVVFALWLAART